MARLRLGAIAYWEQTVVDINRLKSIMVVGFAALSACSPYIYRDEVKQFSDGVDQAAAAFNGLHEEMRAKHRKQELDDFARAGTPLVTSDLCTSEVTAGIREGRPFLGRLVADTNCLAEWSAWRAAGQPGDKPSCPENVSNAVREGKLDFYDLEAVREAEQTNCRLGLRGAPGGPIDYTTLVEAETLLVNAPKLVSALRTYADALVAIVRSEDHDELRSSVGEAKLTLNGLAGQVDSLSGDEARTLEKSVGLAGDLVGTALLAGLDYRRFQSLKNVTEAANPTIQETAMLLSQISMPMVTLSLQDAGQAYLDKVSETNDRPTDDAWYKAYDEAQKAHDGYFARYQLSPTSVFRSMATAHDKLTKTLQDPKAQVDALRESIKDFKEKAEAAYETFTQ